MNKIKIIVLGANGLLGNNLLIYFLNKKYNVKGVIKNKNRALLDKKNYFFSGSLLDKKKTALNLNKIFKKFQPNLIINCVGITKKNKDTKLFKRINSELPKIIEKVKKKNSHLIHFSTDCIFDGNNGDYNENSIACPTDIYGKSKKEGEINISRSTTIRCSMVGHSSLKNNGLMEWFFSQKKKIKGFSNSYFTGPTCLEIAKIIDNYFIKAKILQKEKIINIGSNRISKYDLLKIISKIYVKKIVINKTSKPKIDRSLNISRFKKITNYKVKSWKKLLEEQKNFYEKNKKRFV